MNAILTAPPPVTAEAVAWLRGQIGHDIALAPYCLDPREAVTDAEAKLAILDLHCDDPCETVRLLAGAYRYRDGYGEHWGAR